MDSGAARAAGDTLAVVVGKVPDVTLGFWLVKVIATTLGETGGDWVSMTLGLGYLAGSIAFAAMFVVLVAAEVRSRVFRPWLYWATIVATTTLGTTLADFADRSLGIGYPGGVAVVSALLVASFAVWWKVEGSVSLERVDHPRAEWFYWVTILFSQTLGTALGDWIAGSDRGGLGLGYGHGALLFGGALVVVAVIRVSTRVSRTTRFWLAFVLTRPLGATLGDLLDKPLADGGLQVGRLSASLVLLLCIVVLVSLLPQRPARTSGVPSP